VSELSTHAADVTIVAHGALPYGAPDDVILARAFQRRGATTRVAVWNDPGVDWAACPRTVVRSTWDYYRHQAPWHAWIDRAAAATTLLNPPNVLRWNGDKRYLRDLARRGVACVPTEVIEPGGSEPLATLVRRRGWTDVVVKPAIAASAFGARRFAGGAIGDDGEAHVRWLAGSGAVLVQPYLEGIEHVRERSLVYLAGMFSHAFTKSAFSTNAVGATSVASHDASPEELRLAADALAAARAAVPVATVYARVDLAPDTGGPLLMELELIEPDLALRLDPDAANRLADACLQLPIRRGCDMP
jgi:glutathione synthase/RimK-type ligase-like ATP-grasp enzyme